MKQSKRQKSIENQVKRLKNRILQLQMLSRRLSWIRLGIFLLGIVATYMGTVMLGELLGGLVLACFIAIFTIIVRVHHKLERGITRFQVWFEMKTDLLARMRRDWSEIPEPSLDIIRGEMNGLALDLDIIGPRSLHHLIDMAVSTGGSRLLAEWFTKPETDLSMIHRRQNLVRELIPMARFRERLRLSLLSMSQGYLESEKVTRWLSFTYTSGQIYRLFAVSIGFVSLNTTLLVLNLVNYIPPFWIFTLGLYAFFLFSSRHSVGPFLASIIDMENDLKKLCVFLHYLETYPYIQGSRLKVFCECFHNCKVTPSSRMRKIRILSMLVGMRMNPFIGSMLNMGLPWDFTIAYLADRQRVRMAALLQSWLDRIYELECLVSLATFGFLNIHYTFPDISDRSYPVCQAKKIGHPLIPPGQMIANDFSVNKTGQVMVITGSNMAGKSTFIKTIGINHCLAYAGATVCASRLQTLVFRLFTCIRITDSVIDGCSYFYGEVRCLKELLDKLNENSDLPLLYMIDEIFKGTNNRERLIGSRSYVRSLVDKNGIGFLATHDLELAGLSDAYPDIVNFHFRDHVEDEKLVFDYKIRPGPGVTTNAIKIMQMQGLPIQVNNGRQNE